MGYIYAITNSVNNKVYVGQTIRPVNARFRQHINDAKKYSKNSNIKLYNAINRYGSDKFSVCVIEECEAESLNEREKYWIKYYDSFHNGYNTTSGGGGKSIANDKKIIDFWNKGMIVMDIVSETGHAQETVIGSLISSGVSQEEMRERARKSQSDKVKVAVHQYTLDGDYVASYKSIWDAEKETGIHHGCINGVLCGIHYSAGFYQWSRTKVDNIGKCEHQFCATARTVYQYTLEGKYVRSHKSFTQAAKAVGLKSILPIRRVCYGRAHTSKGFRWSLQKYEQLPIQKKVK